MMLPVKIAAGVLALGFVGICVLAAVSFTPDIPLDRLKARWARPPSAFLALDGMQVHYQDQGPRDDPSPIVLLHATGSSLQSWDGWVDQLKAHRRVITLDRPGFGLTVQIPRATTAWPRTAAFSGDFWIA